MLKKVASGPDYGPDYHRVPSPGPGGVDIEQQDHTDDSSQAKHSHGSSLRHHPSLAPVLAGLLYCTSSGALTLLNKKVLAHYNFTAVHMLLLFHCALAVALVWLCMVLRLGKVEPLTWGVAALWMPVNLLFVGMLATNFYALQSVGVGMVSLLKNLSNLFIIVGDWVFFGRTYTWHVWLCLALMVGSVVTGGITDTAFSLSGYFWQMVNNCFTAAYALYLSGVTERLSNRSSGSGGSGGKGGVNQLSMVYYNNLLSIPLVLLLLVGTNELGTFSSQPALHQRSFQVFATLGGVLGFAISFSSIWFVSLTTATYYSLAGSLNKVVIAAAGIWMFNEPTDAHNLTSIAVGLAAGTLLPFIKTRARGASPARQLLAKHGAFGTMAGTGRHANEALGAAANGAGKQAAAGHVPVPNGMAAGADAAGYDMHGGRGKGVVVSGGLVSAAGLQPMRGSTTGQQPHTSVSVQRIHST